MNTGQVYRLVSVIISTKGTLWWSCNYYKRKGIGLCDFENEYQNPAFSVAAESFHDLSCTINRLRF